MRTQKIFNAVQKQIILAQSCAAGGNPDDAIEMISKALKLNPDLATRKLLEKAADEFSFGLVAIGADYLDSALDAAENPTMAAVALAAPSMESAAEIMGLKIRPGEPDDLTIAQLIRQRADLLAALEKSLDYMVGNEPSIGYGNKVNHNQWWLSCESARAAIQSLKGNAK